MSTIEDLCLRDISYLAPLIEKRDISPVELTEAMLTRIEHLDGRLHSYNTVTAEHALAQARQAEQDIVNSNYRGPLHGIPVAVKDLLFTKGIRTTCSSTILSDWIPDQDATAVQKLYAAGSVLLGKTNMTEFALSGYHPDLPVPVNPWSAEHWPGVSSSGSGVATAAHLAFATLGSDTGGSIRYPSAANAVVGIKPSYGRVSRYGAFPLAQSLDHIGPITKTVADAAIVLNAIAGYDSKDPTTLANEPIEFDCGLGAGVQGLKIGIDDAFISNNSDPRVAAAVMAAADTLAELGAQLCPVDVAGITDISAFWGAVTGVEAAVDHAEYYPSKAAQYGPVFANLLEAAHSLNGPDVAAAYILGKKVKGLLRHAIEQVDLLLCPSMPMLSPTLEDLPPQHISAPEELPPLLCFTAPFNFSGNPTISLPCGFADGLPISLQLVGHHQQESVIIQAAQAYETATDWHKQIAPLAVIDQPDDTNKELNSGYGIRANRSMAGGY